MQKVGRLISTVSNDMNILTRTTEREKKTSALRVL